MVKSAVAGLTAWTLWRSLFFLPSRPRGHGVRVCLYSTLRNQESNDLVLFLSHEVFHNRFDCFGPQPVSPRA